MKTDTQEVTYILLDSGDSELDAMYVIAQMFETYNLNDEERARISEYFFQKIQANQPRF